MRLIIILVIMDNEAAENAVEIDEFCNSIGVLVLNFPAYLGHFLNICDNRVHATIQKYLDKIQAFYGTDTSLEQKYSAFVDAYASVTKDEVLNSLQSIGFGNLTNISDAINRLNRTLSEGLPNHREQHIVQLEAYLHDLVDNGGVIPASPYNYRLPGELWDVYYDALSLQKDVMSTKKIKDPLVSWK